MATKENKYTDYMKDNDLSSMRDEKSKESLNDEIVTISQSTEKIKKYKKKKYDDAIYQYLSDFIGSEVTLTLESGQIVSGKLVGMTTDGLIVLQEAEILSPFIAQTQTIVRCTDVMIATIQI